MCHNSRMAHARFTTHIGDRGRVVVPAELRKRLSLDPGDLLVIEELDDHFVVRKASDVAHGFRGYLRDLEPETDLAAELLAERREEAARESGGGSSARTAAAGSGRIHVVATRSRTASSTSRRRR
jgi:AbrB family looped-hinge helix DNA binding protein